MELKYRPGVWINTPYILALEMLYPQIIRRELLEVVSSSCRKRFFTVNVLCTYMFNDMFLIVTIVPKRLHRERNLRNYYTLVTLLFPICTMGHVFSKKTHSWKNSQNLCLTILLRAQRPSLYKREHTRYFLTIICFILYRLMASRSCAFGGKTTTIPSSFLRHQFPQKDFNFLSGLMEQKP